MVVPRGLRLPELLTASRDSHSQRKDTHAQGPLAAAAALTAAAFAAPAAQANTILQPIIERTLEGCYGVGVIVCDPHVTSRPYDMGRTPVPVCTGTCQTVNVPTPDPNGQPLCVGWTDETGGSAELCALERPK